VVVGAGRCAEMSWRPAGALPGEHCLGAVGADVLFRDILPGHRLNDEEIAIVTQLRQMVDWVRGDGPPPYPLADGLQDHRIASAIEEAADTDRTVRTTCEAWA